ncbi:mRNA binding protein puf3 [Ascosphaera pollenicola]|nr:mRNA binding protein puf3 [Ascosphaera pollenicola]
MGPSSQAQIMDDKVQASEQNIRAITLDSTSQQTPQEVSRPQQHRQYTRFASYFANPSIPSSVGSVGESTVASLLSDTSPIISRHSESKESGNAFIDNASSSTSKTFFDPFASVLKSATMENSHPFEESQISVTNNKPSPSASHGSAISSFSGFPTTLSVPTSAGTMTSDGGEAAFQSFPGWGPLPLHSNTSASAAATYGYLHDNTRQTSASYGPSSHDLPRTYMSNHDTHPNPLDLHHITSTESPVSGQSELSAAAARFEHFERAALNTQGSTFPSRSSGYGMGATSGLHDGRLPHQSRYNHRSSAMNSQPDTLCPPFDAFNPLPLPIGSGPHYNTVDADCHNGLTSMSPIGTHTFAHSLAPQRRLPSCHQNLHPSQCAVGTPTQAGWPHSSAAVAQDIKRSLYSNTWLAGIENGSLHAQQGLFAGQEHAGNAFAGSARYLSANNGAHIHAQHSSLSPYVQPPSHLQPNERLEDKLQKPPASALMLAFRRDPNALKTWTIKMIENHIAEFAGDQQGSRLIQNRLDSASSEDKMMVYTEMRPNVRQFMNDIYANYIVQKLFDLMDMPHKLDLASSISGHMRRLSMHTYGCRVVQKSLEVLIDPQRAELIHELDGFVDKAISDQNGNHVIQKAVEFVDNSSIDFIINFFKGNIRRYSKHAYGCRVVQRMLEHCEASNLTWILQEIRDCAGELIRDTYGNYVVQHIIKRGPVEDRRFLENIIAQRMVEFSKHKYASNVVECAIKNTESENVMAFAAPLKASSSTLLAGMRDPYTNYVIQTLLETLKGQPREEFATDLRALFPKLKEKKETESINQKQITALEAHLFSPSYTVAKEANGTSLSLSEKAVKRDFHAEEVDDVDSATVAVSALSLTGEHLDKVSTPRRNRRTCPVSLKQVNAVSPTALTDALDRSVHGSSSAHTGSDPSYTTDTTATTPSMTEAVPDVQTPLSSTTNSLNDGTSGRQYGSWRDAAYAHAN